MSEVTVRALIPLRRMSLLTMHLSNRDGLTVDEQITHFTIWALLVRAPSQPRGRE